jgi:hypothetical protein
MPFPGIVAVELAGVNCFVSAENIDHISVTASRGLATLRTIAIEPPAPIGDIVDLFYEPPVIKLGHSITIRRAYEIVVH